MGYKLDHQTIRNYYDKSKNKASFRTNLIFNNDIKIYLSFVRNNYIIAHYNDADFSMLGDFYAFKEKLSIVNKSFVTLGKPLIYEHSNVHIRDTMLLAPAGKSSLDALGKLYEGDFKKRIISVDDLNNMSNFLKRDKKHSRNMLFKMRLLLLNMQLLWKSFI